MCLVKIIIEVYMKIKNKNKMFGSCVVMVVFQSVFYLKIH